MTAEIIIMGAVLWLGLGWLGSRHMFRHWGAHDWVWDNGMELLGRILMFLGPFNLLSAVVTVLLCSLGGSNGSSATRSSVKSSWFRFKLSLKKT